MFEEFREQANQALEEQLEEEALAEENKDGIAGLVSNLDAARIRAQITKFTPFQRAVIATLLLVVVCLFSVLCLLMTGSIAPPL